MPWLPAVAIVAGLVVAPRIYWAIAKTRLSRPSRLMDDRTADRESVYRGMIASVAGVVPNAPTAKLLLSESKDRYKHADEHRQNIESKATALLSVVAGATSALGIFGMTRDGKTIVATVMSAHAVAAAIVALVCLLFVLRAKRVIYPNIAAWVSKSTISYPNEAALALVLAESYNDSANINKEHTRRDSIALFLASVSIALAAVLVIIQATVPRQGGFTSRPPLMRPNASTSHR
jgi:hypothetical protein